VLKVRYTDSLEGVTADMLAGLHVGWPKPPSPATHLKSLRNMNAVMLAIDDETGRVVGFVSGMTDETLILFIWDIEVRPEYQGKGIGSELLRRLLDTCGDLYQVNLHTDTNLVVGMTRMNRDLQDGGPRAAE